MNRILAAFAAILIFACGDREPSDHVDAPAAQDTSRANIQYFPVADFLRSEIVAVDSLPVGIMRYRSSALSNDSGYIQPEEFHALAMEFVTAELAEPLFKKEFQETSFFDRSSDASTFFYSTKNNALSLKRVDVVTAKGAAYDQVKSIYLEKSYQSGDSSITKKLHWKPGRNFQIIKQVSKGSGDPETELIKVVWDNRE